MRSKPHLAADSVALAALVVAALLAGWLAYRAPRAADMPLDTPSAILPTRAFHDLERYPDGRAFRWTTGESQLSLPNPGGELRLRLRLLSGPAGPSPLDVYGPGAPLRFTTAEGLRVYHLLLPPSQAERVQLTMLSPNTEVAGRELGVAVSDPRALGGGSAPARLLLALAVASAGLFALLRRAGIGRAASAGIVVALQAGASVFLAAGGWQFAFAERFLLPAGVAAMGAAGLDWWAASRRRDDAKAGGEREDARAKSPAAASRPRAFAWSVGLLALALAARLPWLLAPDPVGDMEIAARRMLYLSQEGLAGAYLWGGDYMPLRLFILWGLSFAVRALDLSFVDPVAPATRLLIKLPQLTADLATVLVLLWWARRQLPERAAAGVAALYTLAPPVWMNAAWWGQVDALLMLPMVGALVLLDRAGGRWSWALWALALLVKTQAVIIVPVLALATLIRHGARGVVTGVGLAGGVFALGCAPLIAAGQGFGLTDAYLGAVGRFPRTTYGAYNLWHLLLGGRVVNDFLPYLGPLTYRQVGLALLAAAVGLALLALWRRPDGPGLARAAAAVALAFFTLSTQMHARYLFLSLAFLALAAAFDRRLLALLALLAVSGALNIFGILSGFWPEATALIRASPLPLVAAVLNLTALVVLLVWGFVPRGRAGAEAGREEAVAAPLGDAVPPQRSR